MRHTRSIGVHVMNRTFVIRRKQLFVALGFFVSGLTLLASGFGPIAVIFEVDPKIRTGG